MIDAALTYARAGLRVFPCHTTISGYCSCGRACGKDQGKHPKIKAWQKAATTNEFQIRQWWERWPDANIGCATGGGLVVIDIDGPEELAVLQEITRRIGTMPKAPAVQTGRGLHLYLRGDVGGSRKVDGLLVRGNGGYVILPPSWHASGKRYIWATLAPIPNGQSWLDLWIKGAEQHSDKLTISALGPIPPHLGSKARNKVAGKSVSALKTPYNPLEEKRIREALQTVPADCPRDTWLHIGMALHQLDWQRSDGTDIGFDIWHEWSQTGGDKFQGLFDLETRWKSFGKDGRSDVTLGTLFHIAEQHGWKGTAGREADAPFVVKGEEVVPNTGHAQISQQFVNSPPPTFTSEGGAARSLPSGETNGYHLPDALTRPSNSDSPLIQMNDQYSVIGDVGGKCLVLGFVASKVDQTVRVPSFQTFRSFTERFANKYVTVMKPKGDSFVEEPAQLGSTWLKWKQRKTYEGIDLVPGAPAVMDGNILNLWSGFAIEPRKGEWPRMQEHIFNILAHGDLEAFEYIMRWAAWKCQNPGERPEVALVFKGAKGSGKGTFANALRRMFGQHGLQIFNSKHLVGSFNGHLRNCLLLFADEAFWAGDKSGESVLKGMLTEPTLMIEQKGVDAIPWRNQLAVIMAANADWVVPASHDERRYAMFDVGDSMVRNEKYFKTLRDEMANGGLQAMLYDLQQLPLKDWHPRRIPQTEALQTQKLRSLDPRYEWFEMLLQDGILPGLKNGAERTVETIFLWTHAKENAPRLRDLSMPALGRFLSDQGCQKIHSAVGNAWRFNSLSEHRQKWMGRFGNWRWSYSGDDWLRR